MPNVITINNKTINYVYSADGTKQQKIFDNNTTDYLSGFQYENGRLQFVPTSEGYYDFANARYVYNYTDHLGNIRVSYYKDAKIGRATIFEENNYYPFGLLHAGYNDGYNEISGGFGRKNDSYYQYKYNGKELQTETNLYDFVCKCF